MKKLILLLSFGGFCTFIFGQEPAYSTIADISYYPEGVSQSDEYINERCVLDLYYPHREKGFATIIWFHGGGLTGGNKYIPEALKEKGVAVIAANYRLYPKVKAPVYIEDAAAAVAWAFKNIEQYGGDPSLVFVSGHSAGGYLASMLGLDKRWLKAHGIDANAIAGLIPFSGHTITHFTVREERGIEGTQPVIDELAPLYHVRADAPPLLLITGDRELEILGRYEENAYLMRMMKAAGHQETRLLELDGYGHGMEEPAFPLLLREVERIIQKNKEAPPETFLLYKNFPSKYITPRNVEVWLPEKYEELDALPVLYMFDGQNIFHPFQGWGGELNLGWRVDEVLDSLNKAGTVPEIIVVGVHSSGARMAEYMPEKPRELVQQRIRETDHEWYKYFKTEPPSSNNQLKFIVEELKPFIDAHFKTKKDRANTFIAGSSMGGLMSAYAICEYPEVFGGAACFSTHWPPLDGVFLEYLKTNLPDPAAHKIYFDHGTEGLDGEYKPFQQIADEVMKARGYEQGKNWITREFEGGKHYEDDWHARFHIPMEFLLR